MEYAYLAQSVIARQTLMREQALAALNAPEVDLSSLFDAAWRVRRHSRGQCVQALSNAKSDLGLETEVKGVASVQACGS